jgi:pyruvate/2-oxoglutarate dehydrogenase complex dihydrolipoamide acyltransferase (E2) component
MFVFELPEIGEGVVEGEIVKWLAQVGEPVKVDQPLCEIMTDKATVEISSPRAGVINALHGKEGDVVKVHAPLVEIDESGAGAVGAAKPDAKAAKPAPQTKAAPPPPAPATAPSRGPAPPKAAPANGSNGHTATQSVAAAGKTLATPAVRSHARTAGVEIETVPASGKGGRVTHADIDAFVAHPSALKAPAALPIPTGGADERIRIIGLRRKIAEKMVESYRTVPHFTYVDEFDATALHDARANTKAIAERYGIKLTYIPFIMKALSVVFREFRTVNAVMDEKGFELVVRGEHNIGIATDTPAGLYVPVVHNVEQKSILELAREVEDLTTRTRDGKVALDELQGGTFTITSVGNIGGRFATPIINHPEVAILGVNQIHDRPVVKDGQIVARKMMYLSPSFDHRVIDGAVAARFVAALKAVLEHPEALLLELR